jgi:hypothetical protein
MNSARHEISPEEIMAHRDGELAADRAVEVAAHLASCSECSTLADSFDGVSKSVASWTIEETVPILRSQVRDASAHLPWSRLSAKARGMGFAGLSVMAILALAVTGGRYQQKLPAALAINDKSRVDVGADYLSRLPQNAQQRKEPDLPLNGRSYTSLTILTPGVAPDAPMIARSVDLQIIAKDFSAVRGELDRILVRHQGYAANLSVSNTDNTARALSASLRIPAPQLSAALDELKSLGGVTAEAQSGEEVTSQHADLVARIKNSRETEIRLQDILQNRTGKVSDILEVEQEIARVRGEIEQMESELKTLNHRVDFATINLTINEEYQAKVSGSTPAMGIRLHNATVAGFASAASSALRVILWLMEIMPSLLLWATILGFPAWWSWRRTRRAFASAV